MRRYRLTGNYGTFEITKVVEAETEQLAWAQTGVMYDLELAGWEFSQSPEGEEWEIEELWSPTHMSVSDASTARVVDRWTMYRGLEGEAMFQLDNENGDRWTDSAALWEEVT